MTTRARATRKATHYLPDSSPADDNDLDHRVVCDVCGRPYLIAGKGWDRHVQPDHEAWCPRHRPASPAGPPGGPAGPVRVPEVPEVPEVYEESTRASRDSAGGAA